MPCPAQSPLPSWAAASGTDEPVTLAEQVLCWHVSAGQPIPPLLSFVKVAPICCTIYGCQLLQLMRLPDELVSLQEQLSIQAGADSIHTAAAEFSCQDPKLLAIGIWYLWCTWQTWVCDVTHGSSREHQIIDCHHAGLAWMPLCISVTGCLCMVFSHFMHCKHMRLHWKERCRSAVHMKDDASASKEKSLNSTSLHVLQEPQPSSIFHVPEYASLLHMLEL